MAPSSKRFDVVVVGSVLADDGRAVRLAAELSKLSGMPASQVRLALLHGEVVARRDLGHDRALELGQNLGALGAEVELRPARGRFDPDDPLTIDSGQIPTSLEPDTDEPLDGRLSGPKGGAGLGPPPQFAGPQDAGTSGPRMIQLGPETPAPVTTPRPEPLGQTGPSSWTPMASPSKRPGPSPIVGRSVPRLNEVDTSRPQGRPSVQTDRPFDTKGSRRPVSPESSSGRPTPVSMGSSSRRATPGPASRRPTPVMPQSPVSPGPAFDRAVSSYSSSRPTAGDPQRSPSAPPEPSRASVSRGGPVKPAGGSAGPPPAVELSMPDAAEPRATLDVDDDEVLHIAARSSTLAIPNIDDADPMEGSSAEMPRLSLDADAGSGRPPPPQPLPGPRQRGPSSSGSLVAGPGSGSGHPPPRSSGASGRPPSSRPAASPSSQPRSSTRPPVSGTPRPSPQRAGPPPEERLAIDYKAAGLSGPSSPSWSASGSGPVSHGSMHEGSQAAISAAYSEVTEHRARRLLGGDAFAATMLGLALSLAVTLIVAHAATRSMVAEEGDALEEELADSINKPIAVERGDLRDPDDVEAELRTLYRSHKRRFYWMWLGAGVPLGLLLGRLKATG